MADAVLLVDESTLSYDCSVEKQTTMQEEHLSIISSQLCKWAPSQVSDTGFNWEQNLWRAASIAVATINTVAQMQIAQKRYEIADAYTKLAEDHWRRFRDNYAPFERELLAEVSSTPIPKPDYEGAKNRGEEATAQAYAEASDQLHDMALKYNLCVDSSLADDLDYHRAIVRDDTINFNYRDEERFALYKDDKRWDRRSDMLNLGRDIYKISASYAQQANAMLAQVGELANQGAQGAARMLGYLQAARETLYPSTFSGASPMTDPAGIASGTILTGPSAGSGTIW